MTTHYSISKTTKAEIDNRRAKLMLNKLARLNHNGQL